MTIGDLRRLCMTMIATAVVIAVAGEIAGVIRSARTKVAVIR